MANPTPKRRNPLRKQILASLGKATSPYDEYCKKKEAAIQFYLHNEELPEAMQKELQAFRGAYCVKRDLRVPSQECYLRSIAFLGFFLAARRHKSFKHAKKEDLEQYLGTLATKSTSVQEWAKISLKVFYRWLLDGKVGKRDPFPEMVKWISISFKKTKRFNADDMLTLEDLTKMLKACRNTRDRVMLLVLFEGGLRLGELLNIQIKDVHLEADMPYIDVKHSKTDPRPIYLIESAGEVRALLEIHPDKKNLEAFLFAPTSLNKQKKRNYIEQQLARRLIYRIAERAGLKRKVIPHLFRHSGATLDRKIGMSDQYMRLKYGWSENSRMPDSYAHPTHKDVAKFLMRAKGFQVQDDDSPKPKICLRCKKTNPTGAEYCSYCNMPLDEAKYREYIAKKTQEDDRMNKLERRVDKMEDDRAKRTAKNAK